MTLKKDEAFHSILSDYEKLANLVLSQLDEVKSLISSGELKPEDERLVVLKRNEGKVNKLEVKLSENVINSIVLYQPVASELRRLIACYRIIISLERIGDLAITIIKLMKKN